MGAGDKLLMSQHCAGLQRLSLRQNLLTDASNLSQANFKPSKSSSTPQRMQFTSIYSLVDNPSVNSSHLGHVAALQALVLHDNQLTEVRAAGSCLVCTFLFGPSAIQPTAAAVLHADLQIPQLAGYTALQTLEVSYNSISSLQPLTSLQSTSLKELYVANNAVQHIEVEWQILMQNLSKCERPHSCKL